MQHHRRGPTQTLPAIRSAVRLARRVARSTGDVRAVVCGGSVSLGSCGGVRVDGPSF
jgi:hypothetical protein